MLDLVLGLCAIALTVAIVRYLSWKQRRSENQIQTAVEQKINAGSVMTELAQLREERLVMRNLLSDILDNEASVQHATAAMPDDDRVRLLRYRKERRFELFGESLAVLGQMKPPEVKWPKIRA